MFHNSFVILAIHKFCYFNLVVSLLHCNHQYPANFDTCHDLHGLVIGEHVPHLPVEVLSYIVSHQALEQGVRVYPIFRVGFFVFFIFRVLDI
jgi:hypothetical protein